jgi:YHS domain-containing protein
MITSLIAAFLFAAPAPPALACPIMAAPVRAGQPVVDFNAVRVSFCCAGCDVTFKKDPARHLAQARGRTVGEFLFDPVSRTRIVPARAEGGWSDFRGVRFFFHTAANKAEFDREPAKFGTLPRREALQCPVSRERLASYIDAWAYIDVEGVRYYICCARCVPTLSDDPGMFVGHVAAAVGAPKAHAVSKEDLGRAKTGACGGHDRSGSTTSGCGVAGGSSCGTGSSCGKGGGKTGACGGPGC